MNTDISQEQVLNTYEIPPIDYYHVLPYVHEIFIDTLDFVHKMVFNIKPLHSQPNEQGMFEAIFKNPLPGIWLNKNWKMEYLIYLDIGCCSAPTKQIVHSEDERQACLVITYDKSSQEVTVKLLKLISNEYTSIQYSFGGGEPFGGREPIYQDRLFLFNQKDDFFYLLDKWMHMDCGNKNFIEINQNFRTICSHYLNHIKPYIQQTNQARIIFQQARKKQKLNDVWMNPYLTDYVLDSGLERTP